VPRPTAREPRSAKLERLTPGGASEYTRPLERVAESLRRRSLVVLISDLYESPQTLLSAIGQLRYRGNDLIVFHLLDPLELNLELGDVNSVEDLESGRQLPLGSDEFGREYRKLIGAHQAELEKKFGANQIDYIFADISQPLDNTLFRYLTDRERQSRTR